MKTFLTIFISVLISLAVFAGGIFYFVNYLTFEDLGLITINKSVQTFGTTLTDLQSSDTMSDFPTLYNANNLALNNGKIEVSTTSLGLLTAAANLVTVGTITTGVWTGTAITVAKGGTGSTTLSQYQVLLGSSTNAVSVVNGLGSAGQFLTSAGAGAKPYWASASVNQGDNYTWTGEHIWNASSTFNNTLWLNSNLYLNRISYTFPPTQSASSTSLSTDGSGNLNWSLPAPVFAAGSTTIMTADTEENSSAESYTLIKEISVWGHGTIRVRFDINNAGTGTAYGRIYKNGVAVGTARSTTEATYKQYLEDISGVEAGDLIQLYGYDATPDVQVKNFRIYSNTPPMGNYVSDP